MVVLDYPDDTCHKFFLLENTAFGPTDVNGDYQAVQIDLMLNSESFDQSKGLCGENNIVHSSFHGRLYYYPILADCAPNPKLYYPRSLTFPIVETPKTLSALYGFGCPDVGALVFASSSQCWQQAIRRDSPKQWTMIRLSGTSPTASMVTVYRYVFTFNRWITPTSCSVTHQYQYSTTKVPFSGGFVRSAQFQDIWDTQNAVSRWSNLVTSTKTCTGGTTDPSAIDTPSTLSHYLESFADSLMSEEFPLPEVNYGDLAATAVAQRRVIDTNLFEFLKDLPSAKDMIPKLKNLLNLKTHAGNLLAVKYGILPTISDLKQIVNVFKAKKAYLDKYGNTVYNASHKDELNTGSGKFTLAQYIKVCVANEDNQFLELLDKLDQFGFGLTFENLWDLTKYSFVIDWFVDVGGFLERVDNNLRLLRYNIPYVTMSRKKTASGEIPQDGRLTTIGPIEWRYYHRWTTSRCPLPPLTLSTTPTVSNHWLEAGALLIQRAL